MEDKVGIASKLSQQMLIYKKRNTFILLMRSILYANNIDTVWLELQRVVLIF